MSLKHEYKIKDFIGIFDGFLDPKICDELIELFKEGENFGKTFKRIDVEKTGQAYKKDDSLIVGKEKVFNYRRNQLPEMFGVSMDICVRKYLKETDILKFIDITDLHWNRWKIQKTEPGGGYHLWHVEHGVKLADMSDRVIVFTVYLNDVEEGGETEFLFQKQRCKAKKGRICLFPAFFPYVHRGNPPLSGDKYIATGWFVQSPWG